MSSGEATVISNENTCMRSENLAREMKVKGIVSCACFSIWMWNTDYMEIAPPFQPLLPSVNRPLAAGFFRKGHLDECSVLTNAKSRYVRGRVGKKARQGRCGRVGKKVRPIPL